MSTNKGKYRKLQPAPKATTRRAAADAELPVIVQIARTRPVYSHPGRTFDIPTAPVVQPRAVAAPTPRPHEALVVAPRSFPLPQHIIDRVIDCIAEDVGHPDYLHSREVEWFAHCSLISRAFRHRSSHHLFRRVILRLPGDGEDGEDASFAPLEKFHALCTNSSSRLRKYVARLDIRAYGLTFDFESARPILDRIIAALPNLDFLSFCDAIVTNFSVSSAQLSSSHTRHTIDSLELSRGRPLTLLGLFSSIRKLCLRWPQEIALEDVPKSQHLAVTQLELKSTKPDDFRVLQRVLRPGTLQKLSMEGTNYFVWDPSGELINTTNIFLETHAQNLEHLALEYYIVSDHERVVRFFGLQSCTKLNTVELVFHNRIIADDIDGVYQRVLSYLPASVRKLRVTFKTDGFEREPWTAEINWEAFETCLTPSTRLQSVEIAMDVKWRNSLVTGEPAHMYEKRHTEAAENWLFAQQNMIPRVLRRIVSFDYQLVLWDLWRQRVIRRVAWKIPAWNVTQSL